MFEGNFENWEDVLYSFHLPKAQWFVPDEVILASYDVDGYDGKAKVGYRVGDKFYYNYGSHCSCYGLEDQWDPEEIETREILLKLLGLKPREP